MNTKLKGKIVEKYGTQADFAQAIKEDEAKVSRVVRNRRVLDLPSRRKWANLLKCDIEEIFSGK